jgi:hypothetical protein
MNDKELLEFAAKAAGFGSPEKGRTCWTESEYPRNSGKHGALWNYVGHMDMAELWNPLTDDGDALRLAVKLEINVLPIMEVSSARNPSYTTWCNEDASADSYAATRRAIVRAAAEIGKSL